MDKMQALHSFWNSFEINAYDENTIPDDAQLPYITYEAVSDEWGEVVYPTASIWYKSFSWLEVTAKEREISKRITRGGRMIPYDDGAMWIQMRTPWAQRLSDESNDTIRRIVLNVTIEFMD